MSSRTPNAKILFLAALMTLSQSAWAGKLDVDFAETSPTKALVYGLAFPGGGHYFLSSRDTKYRKKFYLFLATGIASGLFLGSQLKTGNKPMLLTAVLVAGGVKIWEFGSVTDDAEYERLKVLKENFRTTDLAAMPVK